MIELFQLYRINTQLCFCSVNSWIGFLITVLMVVQLEFPSLWIEGELAQCCSLWTAVSALYKGAIRDMKMGFTLGMKSYGCYNNN